MERNLIEYSNAPDVDISKLKDSPAILHIASLLLADMRSKAAAEQEAVK